MVSGVPILERRYANIGFWHAASFCLFPGTAVTIEWNDLIQYLLFSFVGEMLENESILSRRKLANMK